MMLVKRQHSLSLNAGAILLKVFGCVILLGSFYELVSVPRQIRRPLPSSLRGGGGSPGQDSENNCNLNVITMGPIFPPDIPQPLVSFPEDAIIKEFHNSSDLDFSAGATSSTIGGKVAKTLEEQAAKAQLLIQAYRYYVPPWWPVHLPRPPPGWLPWPPPVPPVQIMRWLYPHVYTVADHHSFENYQQQTGKKARRNGQLQKRSFENLHQDTFAVKDAQRGLKNPNIESKQPPDDISPIQVLAKPDAK
mmetsp:Transcript_13385/g.21440  ORF Transcript_13385/g.21440 Transcript_13385/m.21440 type:complete len:248 (-) Transcript_13385:229-972(-)